MTSTSVSCPTMRTMLKQRVSAMAIGPLGRCILSIGLAIGIFLVSKAALGVCFPPTATTSIHAPTTPVSRGRARTRARQMEQRAMTATSAPGRRHARVEAAWAPIGRSVLPPTRAALRPASRRQGTASRPTRATASPATTAAPARRRIPAAQGKRASEATRWCAQLWTSATRVTPVPECARTRTLAGVSWTADKFLRADSETASGGWPVTVTEFDPDGKLRSSPSSNGVELTLALSG